MFNPLQKFEPEIYMTNVTTYRKSVLNVIQKLKQAVMGPSLLSFF